MRFPLKASAVPGLALILLTALPTPMQGQGQCQLTTQCRANGHSTISQTMYPYTEEITSDFANQTPVATPQVLTGPTYTWTMISGPCTQIQGNLNGTQAFNAILRAQIQVQSTTAAAGARYEIQFRVDGVEHGWYVRRLRGLYPQLDVFATTATNISSGWHTYTVWARVLDPGTITLSNTYTMGQGSPTTNGGAKSVNAASLNRTTTSFQPFTDSVTVALSTAQDLVVQAYAQINSGTAGQVINFRPFLDGVAQNPITTIGVPPYLYDGFNIITVIPNVAAGTHTISMNTRTNGYLVTFSNRAIDVVAFPAGVYSAYTSRTSQVLVVTPTADPQPYWVWNDGCGQWTKLLEVTIPPDSSAINHMYEGYIRVTQNVSGTSLGHLVFETFYDPNYQYQSIDGGGRFIQVPSYQDGFYIFGDAMLWSLPATETIRMWARKVTCGGGTNGSFYVTDRFLWVKHIPVIGGCWYGP